MHTIVYVVGARPNFPKLAPVERALRLRLPGWRHVCVHTGQHYDPELSEVFLRELEVPPPSYLLGVGSGSHGRQTARALERIEEVLLEEQPAYVLVPGDVNSTLAATLAAVKLDIPVGHVEAGLRSFDRSMPEELNRLLVDQVAEHCFVHSADAVANLRREGVSEDRVVFAGNTMIDTLVRMRPRIDRSRVRERFGLADRDYLLVTLHRPALVDGPLLGDVLARLEAIAADLPVVFPVHPRTRARLGRRVSSRVQLVDPLGYIDFVALEARAAGVVTDSGGVQEETTFLGVPCFTLRDSTERPVTLAEGTNHLLGLDPAALDDVPGLLARPPRPLRPPRGWDGNAATRVADAVIRSLDADVPLAAAGAAHG